MSNVGSGPCRVIEHCWIELRDGCRLAARLWIPEAAEHRPVPALLEYLPYRKRDGTTLRDEVNHGHFAAHGYACARVDIRGNGESDGLMRDEYTVEELADGVEVVEWLAAQPWCSGAVGMIGISWGGFNALQIAALRPPSLKAVITLCSTDDRYATDIHYMGGCLLNDNLTWSQQMLGYSSRPPDPALIGERWREQWMQRLENMPLLAANWLRHPARDAYWRHGSVVEDYGAIDAAVLAVSGWADAYTATVPRLLAGLRGPRKGIIGPWEHHYPNLAMIEPRIDFLGEATRWWDQWLRGIDTGVADEPDLRAYLLDSAPPGSRWAHRAGCWIGERQWPPVEREAVEYHLGDGLLARAPAPGAGAIAVSTAEHHGAACGAFCPGMRVDQELPPDQSADDALAVCFDSMPLERPLAILGAPLLDLEFQCDREVAMLVARLCDVRADGTVVRISWGPLNLTHHAGHATPRPLRPGQRYRATLALDDIGYRVPAGHRLRLALSTTYWPMLWPSPRPATVTLHPGGTRLRVPMRGAEETPAPHLPAAALPQMPARTIVRAPGRRTASGVTATGGDTVSETEDDFGAALDPGTGLETASSVRQRFSIQADDPLSARAEARWTHELARGEWRVRTESRTMMRADAGYFHLEARLLAFEQGVPVFDRTWQERIARSLL